MRKMFLAVVLSFITIECFSQVVITMEEDGGVYRIPCLVNGAKMKFIFDTGASTVCISESMAEYLYDNDYISKSDFVGLGQSTVADGRIVNNLHLILRDIEIAGLHLTDVEAVVIEGQKAPLLLGLSAINKLGKIQINGNILTIAKANPETDVDARIDYLLDKASEYRRDGLYSKAKECYSEVYGYNGLSDVGIHNYIRCCMQTQDYQNALHLLDDITDYDALLEKDINIYRTIGWVYEENNMFQEGRVYYEKAFNAEIPSNNYEEKAYIAWCIGNCYNGLKYYPDAAKNYNLAVYCIELSKGLRSNYLFDDCFGKLKKGEKSYRTEEVDRYVYYWLTASRDAGQCSESDFLYNISILASRNNRFAIGYCNRIKFDYQYYLSLHVL